MAQRKRKNTSQGSSITKKSRSNKYKFNRGYDRTAGFYGRYNRSSLRSSSVSELKYFDTSISTLVPTTGVIIPTAGTLVPIPVGTGPSERIGRQVRVKSINAYLTVSKNSSNNSTETVRLLYVLDTQCNGATPTVAEILASPAHNSFRNMANTKRFVILRDHEINITSQTWDGTNFASVSRQVNFFRKVNIPVEYDQTLNTGAITTIRSNNLIILAICQAGNGHVAGTVRIRYDD